MFIFFLFYTTHCNFKILIHKGPFISCFTWDPQNIRTSLDAMSTTLPPSRDPSSTAHTLPVKIEQFPLPLVYRFVFCCMFCWGVYGFGGEVFWICLLALWLLMDLGWWSSLWCLWLLFWYWGCWANNKNTILLLYIVQ